MAKILYNLIELIKIHWLTVECIIQEQNPLHADGLLKTVYWMLLFISLFWNRLSENHYQSLSIVQFSSISIPVIQTISRNQFVSSGIEIVLILIPFKRFQKALISIYNCRFHPCKYDTKTVNHIVRFPLHAIQTITDNWCLE